MSDKHTGPYVPEAFYRCDCGALAPPDKMAWSYVEHKWLCQNCRCALSYDFQLPHATYLADHLKSLEPRWVPVSERLPEFDCHLWDGFAVNNRTVLAGTWAHGLFLDGTITEWLNFNPPELPGEEVGG